MAVSDAVLTTLGVVGTGAMVGFVSTTRHRPYLPGGLAEYDPRAADPLRRALRWGMAGAYLPVWPGANGELYVGKSEPRRPDRSGRHTLRRGVLEPLLRRVAAIGGRVHRGSTEPFDLIIELPGDEAAPGLALRAYQMLAERLRDHAAILTRWSSAGLTPGPVMVTITGRLSVRSLLADQSQRFAFVDGTLDDLGSSTVPAELAPLLSEHWTWRFGWDGQDEMPPEERHLLHFLVAQAHAEGRRVRFFGVPTRPRAARLALWRELSAAGVDLIGARRLRPLTSHLRRYPVQAKAGPCVRRLAPVGHAMAVSPVAEPAALGAPAVLGEPVAVRAPAAVGDPAAAGSAAESRGAGSSELTGAGAADQDEAQPNSIEANIPRERIGEGQEPCGADRAETAGAGAADPVTAAGAAAQPGPAGRANTGSG